MEVTRPKKKRRPKTKAPSGVAKEVSTTVQETPVSSGASVTVLSDPLTTPKDKQKPSAGADADHVTTKDEASKPLVIKEILPQIEPELNKIEGTEEDGVTKNDPVENQASVLVLEQNIDSNTEGASVLVPEQALVLEPEQASALESEQASVLVPEQTLTEENVAPLNIEEQEVATSHLTEESTNEIAEHSTPRLETVEPTNQMVEPSAPSHVMEELANQSVVPSAPALLELSETSQLAPRVEGVESVRSVVGVRSVETSELLYPQLDSIMQEQEGDEELIPFSEEDLAILCPNRQLDTNSVFVENFLRHTRQERHPLYDLLIVFLKAKQAWSSSVKEMEALQNQYTTHQSLVWDTEMKEVFATGKCSDGSKVTQSHNYRYAVFKVEHAVKTTTALKGMRELIQEELCIRSYSSQLARIHVDNFLFKVVSSYPELSSFGGDAPVTCWVPMCPPGELNPYTTALRDCISVLFMFERKPVQDKEFSNDCRLWLDLLMSALLRIASLSDHRFILNHLLRCPPGVAKWGVKYVHAPSPLLTKHTLHTQFPNGDLGSAQNNLAFEWGVEFGLYGNWGGPLVDHFVTSLATLLFPIEDREAMLALFEIKSQVVESAEVGVNRQISETWTFVESDDEDIGADDSHLLLKETDFIKIFDQFMFTDLFQHILSGTTGGDDFNVERVSSHNILRLFGFGTCLIRLLGAAFSTLRMARYKEFLKQVGRTIRQTVQYLADIWMLYKSHRLTCGDTPTSMPSECMGGDPRYSLNRLQLEFDQFVLRATRWILSAHKLGAWQFLADMPYDSVSMETVWKIFWNIYCKPSPDSLVTSGCYGNNGGGVARDNQRESSPDSVSDIQEAMKDVRYKDQFVDHLMKTYTSQAVFLLTTLVNIARARPHTEEDLINTISLEIFECTQVVDYAKEAYSRTGHTLLDSIAIVHPFITSTLLQRVESVIGQAGENCILLFKELPLHLWIPTSHDLSVISSWLINSPLTSPESLLARIILSGLNWGTKSEEGSSELVLPWSVHCSVALAIVEAHTRHLPTQPGGRDYTPGKYTYLQRFTIATEQTAYVKWAWEVILMLKLHPLQVVQRSMRTLNPLTSSTQEQSDSPSGSDPPWVCRTPNGDDIILPDLTSSSETELAELRDAVTNEGQLAYYVALCITSLGADTTRFVTGGISMIRQLITNGYYLPVLRVLANITPRFFNHREALLEEEGFIAIIVSVCNADQVNASLKEKWTYATPPHFVTKKMSALIQTQLQGACGPSGVGGEKVLEFWLHILLACPNWYREGSILHILDALCMATHSQEQWQSSIQSVLLEAYKELNPIQPSKGLISSVTSSLASMVRQSGVPSLHNAISCSECPWLAFHSLCAEQTFEEEQGIWNALLKQLRKDNKISIDTALKRAFTELSLPGGFPSTHLCIYRWAEFAASLDHTHPVLPLVWQRFFMLYLQRPHLDSSMPERSSQGIRFFSVSRTASLRKRMKSSLSDVCKGLKDAVSQLEEIPQGERRDLLRRFLPNTLSLFQTLRLWLEEPRLHTPDLYLRGLPSQYNPDRLTTVFKAQRGPPWMEFVPLWEVKGQLNNLVQEWMEIAIYQKNLGTKVQTMDSSPEIARTRLQARLKHSSPTPTLPPPFVYINPPVSMVTRDVLMSRDALVAVVKVDLQCIFGQARSYCSKLSTLATLDDQYMEGLPNLYSNEPRQFHVRVPCHSRFNRSRVCQGPATIVFRIEEMTVQPRVEQDLNVNRSEYSDMVSSLSSPVVPELCQLVMKLENTVAELAKIAAENPGRYPNIGLQNGIAIFYEILGFIGQNTRRYPPSRQVLTACLQILGQEFIQRDSQQTSNVLDQLLSQQGNSDILVPLFQPNLSPEEFINMYGTAAEMAVKESPSVAFSVLTKFNIPSWLVSFNPSGDDRSQLLQFISQGLCLSGPTPGRDNALLVELYRKHFVQLASHKFPDQYYEVLRMAINCSDNGSITIDIWNDLCTLVGSHDTLNGCNLSLNLIRDSIKLLSSNYVQKRMISGESLYSLLIKEYVPVIGNFIRGLCLGLVERWVEAVSMETADHCAAENECWVSLVEMFQPWVAPIDVGGDKTGNKVLFPCLGGECDLMAELLSIFVEVITVATTSLKDPESSDTIMSQVWRYYCTSLCLPHTHPHVTTTYHSVLVRLPWCSFTPDLAALDSMMKLRLLDTSPRSCFVFLGRIFPSIEWKRIAASYHDIGDHDNDEAMAVNFHIMLLQLLVMLAAEDQVMSAKDTGMPEVISDAHSFHWETVGAKTYQDVVTWQKKNCDSTAVLNTGSCLFLALRLLKSAAGFPSSNGPPEFWHNDTWEKRMAYVHLVVDLIGRSTLKSSCLSQTYSDALSHLYQTAVDICVNEYTDYTTAHLVPLMQAILNVFSCCQSSDSVLDLLMTVTFDIIEQLPNAHLLTLPTITASCSAIHSIRCMVRVIEHSMERHFTAVPKPQPYMEVLPKDPLCMYGWKSVVQSLIMSDEIVEEFCACSIAEFAGLTLHAQLLQMLPQCTSMAQESRICSKLVGWCTQVKPLAGISNEAKMFLLWEKTLGLLLRQIRYEGTNSDLTPSHFSTIAASMLRYGEDKASEGLLGAIGFGKKSVYSYEFRLISRAMAAFLHCQMPVDQSQTTQLRVVPNAPGHVRDTLKGQTNTPSTPLFSSKTPTKQAEQTLNSLESLIANKNYQHLKEHIIYSRDFVKDPSHCVMDSNKLLMHLCTALYDSYRFLDLMKVLEV